jgi:hypothetical protein
MFNLHSTFFFVGILSRQNISDSYVHALFTSTSAGITMIIVGKETDGRNVGYVNVVRDSRRK